MLLLKSKMGLLASSRICMWNSQLRKFKIKRGIIEKDIISNQDNSKEEHLEIQDNQDMFTKHNFQSTKSIITTRPGVDKVKPKVWFKEVLLID